MQDFAFIQEFKQCGIIDTDLTEIKYVKL